MQSCTDCLIDCSSLFTPFQPLGSSLSTYTRTLSVPTLSGSRWSIRNIIIFSHPVSSPVSIYTTLSRVRSALDMVSNFPDCDWLVLLTFPDLCIDNISCSSPMDISATVCVLPKTVASKGQYRSCWCGGIGDCVSSS